MTSTKYSLAIIMALFSATMLAAYFGLVTYFSFPDILRESPEYILNQFSSNQSRIVIYYYLFVISQVLFITLVLMFFAFFKEKNSALLIVATGTGVLAGLVQAIGFLRWPFLAPFFSDIMTDPNISETAKESVIITFQAFHQFAGIAVGENLFFLLEGIWAICFSIFLYNHKKLSAPLSSVPFISGILILVYSLEQFGGSLQVLAPLNVVAHGALVFWFLALSKLLFTHSSFESQHKVGAVAAGILVTCYLIIVLPGIFT